MIKRVGIALLCILIGFFGMQYFLRSIGIAPTWEDKYYELQDNYEAISKENEELRDSLNYLKLSPIINKSPNYEDTFQTR
jgi:hypothetical protein